MGITQHSTGTQHVMSVANLAMLCGNLGKEGVGVNPRGQIMSRVPVTWGIAETFQAIKR